MELVERRLQILYRWRNGDNEVAIARSLGLSSKRVYQLCVSTLATLSDPEARRDLLSRVAEEDLLP